MASGSKFIMCKSLSFLWNTECNNSSGLTLLVSHQEGHLACKNPTPVIPRVFIWRPVGNVAQPIETKNFSQTKTEEEDKFIY